MNFDQTCRLIASPVSRRDVFKAIFASLAAAAVPWSAEAATSGVVKSKYIRVVNKKERNCNFQLFNKTKNVACPKNTTKKIVSHTNGTPNPNPLCQRWVKSKKGEWIGEATVKCIKGEVSPG